MTYVRNQWDRVGAWVAVALGALVLLIGWLGVSDTAFPAEQIPYIVSGGLGGFFLLGLGAMLWLSADLRDEWRKLDDLDQRLARREALERSDHGSVVGAAPANGVAGNRSSAGVESDRSGVQSDDTDPAPARRRRPSRAKSTTS